MVCMSFNLPNSPQYCDFAVRDNFVNLSGFIYLRNKQGTEYCKATAHLSCVFDFFPPIICSFIRIIPTICFYFNDHLMLHVGMTGS